jgi:hypothetical protein
MKWCRTAALALVGWYLMAPRVIYYDKMTVPAGFSKWATCCVTHDSNPDLSSWNIVASYDTADDCENPRRRLDPNHGQFNGSGLVWSYPFGYPIGKLVSVAVVDSFLNHHFFRPPFTS